MLFVCHIERRDIIELTRIWGLDLHVECCIRNKFCCLYMGL